MSGTGRGLSACKGHKHSVALGSTVCPHCGRYVPDAEIAGRVQAPPAQCPALLRVQSGVAQCDKDNGHDGDHSFWRGLRTSGRVQAEIIAEQKVPFSETTTPPTWAQVVESMEIAERAETTAPASVQSAVTQ